MSELAEVALKTWHETANCSRYEQWLSEKLNRHWFDSTMYGRWAAMMSALIADGMSMSLMYLCVPILLIT